MTSGGPTQVAMSPTRAAGRSSINTVGMHGGRIGPPTCGTIPVTIGHTCISVMRAAGGPMFPSPSLLNQLALGNFQSQFYIGSLDLRHARRIRLCSGNLY